MADGGMDGKFFKIRRFSLKPEWGLCEYVRVHTILGGSPVIL